MKKGFTLIELIVVIAVLGILAAIIVPNISNMQGKATQSAIVSNERNLQTAVDMYALEHQGNLPIPDGVNLTTEQVSVVDMSKVIPSDLRNAPKTKGVYYFIDQSGKVTASMADSPENVSLNGVTLSWEADENANGYVVYKVETKVTAAVSNKSYREIARVAKGEPTTYTLNEVGEVSEYAVSSIDQYGFITPPVTTGYQGNEPFIKGPEKGQSGYAAPTNLFASTTPLGKYLAQGKDSVVVGESNGTGSKYSLVTAGGKTTLFDSEGSISPMGMTGDGKYLYYLKIEGGTGTVYQKNLFDLSSPAENFISTNTAENTMIVSNYTGARVGVTVGTGLRLKETGFTTQPASNVFANKASNFTFVTIAPHYYDAPTSEVLYWTELDSVSGKYNLVSKNVLNPMANLPKQTVLTLDGVPTFLDYNLDGSKGILVLDNKDVYTISGSTLTLVKSYESDILVTMSQDGTSLALTYKDKDSNLPILDIYNLTGTPTLAKQYSSNKATNYLAPVISPDNTTVIWFAEGSDFTGYQSAKLK